MPLLLLLCVLSLAGNASAQSRIVTTTGNSYSGRLENESAESVTIVTSDSARIVLSRDKIASIEYDRRPNIGDSSRSTRSGEESQGYSYGLGYRPLGQVVIDTGDTKQRDFYFAVGGAIGTPGGANIVGAYNAKRWLFKASVGSVLVMTGAQGSMSRKLIWGDSFELNLGLATGGFIITDPGRYGDIDAWLYVGPVMELNFGGFFIELGATVGAGTFDSPMPIGQLGYRVNFMNL